MTAIEIQAIASEVARRLQLLQSSHQALVYLVSDSPGAEVEADCRKLLDELTAQNYALTRWPPPPDTNGGGLETMVGRCDAVVVSGLTIAQLKALRELKVAGTALSLIYEGLRQGKTVYVFSRDLHLSAARPALTAEVRQLTAVLEDWGICFAQGQTSGGKVLTQPLITVRDLQKLERGPLIIGRQAVVTETAQTWLKQRGIQVFRREQKRGKQEANQ